MYGPVFLAFFAGLGLILVDCDNYKRLGFALPLLLAGADIAVFAEIWTIPGDYFFDDSELPIMLLIQGVGLDIVAFVFVVVIGIIMLQNRLREIRNEEEKRKPYPLGHC